MRCGIVGMGYSLRRGRSRYHSHDCTRFDGNCPPPTPDERPFEIVPSFSTVYSSISLATKDLKHQFGGVAPGALSDPAGAGETWRTVGGMATPTAWKTA